MLKKSQIYGQVFIYVIAIVVTSLIFIFGYDAIKNLNNRVDKISCIKLKNELESAVKRMSMKYKSIERVDIQLCSNYKSLCLADYDIMNINNIIGSDDPVIQDSISSGANKNVFLMKEIAAESFYVGKVSVENDVLCLNSVNNLISLKIEGGGDHAIISKWS